MTVFIQIIVFHNKQFDEYDSKKKKKVMNIII